MPLHYSIATPAVSASPARCASSHSCRSVEPLPDLLVSRTPSLHQTCSDTEMGRAGPNFGVPGTRDQSQHTENQVAYLAPVQFYASLIPAFVYPGQVMYPVSMFPVGTTFLSAPTPGIINQESQEHQHPPSNIGKAVLVPPPHMQQCAPRWRRSRTPIPNLTQNVYASNVNERAENAVTAVSETAKLSDVFDENAVSAKRAAMLTTWACPRT